MQLAFGLRLISTSMEHISAKHADRRQMACMADMSRLTKCSLKKMRRACQRVICHCAETRDDNMLRSSPARQKAPSSTPPVASSLRPCCTWMTYVVCLTDGSRKISLHARNWGRITCITSGHAIKNTHTHTHTLRPRGPCPKGLRSRTPAESTNPDCFRCIHPRASSFPTTRRQSRRTHKPRRHKPFARSKSEEC